MQTRERAALHLIDWAGCALAGAGTAPGRALAAMVTAIGSCTAFGAHDADPETAAFVNGGLGNILEMDDLHRASILHAGDVVVPAALAAAQDAGTTPAILLDALVGGYEIAIRIGLAAASSGYSNWYNSGTCGVFGAAFAAGQIYGLNTARMVDALGQAGMQAAGLWQCRLEPTYSKQLATAHAARAGITAARLAGFGFPGPARIIEGELGFLKTLYPNADRAAILATANTGWLLHEVSFKPWPSCRHTHPAIAAALQARAQCNPSDISKIRIGSYAAGLEFCDAPNPRNDHQCRFSLQHCVATSLIRGAPGIEDFEDTARSDSGIAALRSQCSLYEDPELSAEFPSHMGAVLEIRLHQGGSKTFHVHDAPGDPEFPLSYDDLTTKFLRNATWAGVPTSVAKSFLDCATTLPDRKKLDSFWQSLRDINISVKERS
jgi:2-methylcitrate dehydratase PrpD